MGSDCIPQWYKVLNCNIFSFYVKVPLGIRVILVLFRIEICKVFEKFDSDSYKRYLADF